MLTLAQAQTLINAALAEARHRKTNPLGIIVLDPGAHPIASAREDGGTFFRLEIARAKATGALGMGGDTRAIAARAAANPAFYASLSAIVDGRVAFAPGGVLVRDAEGQIVGAVGVSGDTGDVDELCAQAGIRAAGLKHD